MTIDLATTDEDILGCFPVMAELRPHLAREDFVETVRRLMREQGFELAYLSDEGVRSVAGIRVGEWLPTGRYLEIEDFVTAASARSNGYGAALLQWVFAYAAERGCKQVHLASALWRADAHRFYEREGMDKGAFYFSVDVG